MNETKTVDPTRQLEAPERGFLRGPREALLVVLLCTLAAALRVHRLPEWPLDGDEIETLHEAVRLGRPDQILASQNTWLTGPLLHRSIQGLLGVFDDPVFALRFLAAACGVLAGPLLYVLTRRSFGPLVAISTLFLLALSPLHLHASSYGRYYSPTFLLGGVTTLLALIAVRERHMLAGLAAILTAPLAIGIHATALLGAAGTVLAVLPYPGQGRGRRVLALCLAGLLVVLTPFLWLGPRTALAMVLGVWTASVERSFGLGGAKLIASLVHDGGPALPLLGLLGILALFRYRRPDAVFLGTAFLAPLVALTLLGLRVHVGTRYLFGALAPGYVLAGVGLAQLLRPFLRRPLLALTTAALVTVPSVPVLLSQLGDNSRYPVPGVIQKLETEHRAGEPVFAETHALTEFYSGIECTELPGTWDELAAELPDGSRAFVVLLLQRGRAIGVRDSRLEREVMGRMRPLASAGVDRYDMHRFEVALYLWDPDREAGR